MVLDEKSLFRSKVVDWETHWNCHPKSTKNNTILYLYFFGGHNINQLSNLAENALNGFLQYEALVNKLLLYQANRNVGQTSSLLHGQPD